MFNDSVLPPRARSRSKSPKSGSPSRPPFTRKGKETPLAISDGEEEEDSGDEAEKLNEDQLDEIDTIYKKCVPLESR